MELKGTVFKRYSLLEEDVLGVDDIDSQRGPRYPYGHRQL